MEPDESLARYRAAAARNPDLAPQDVHHTHATPAGADDPTARFPDEYHNFHRLARTRLSTTWRARDSTLRCAVVIKELAAELLPDPRARNRFQREAQIVARLAHPNIVPIRSAHFNEPPYFFTMPLIEGTDLKSYCDQQKLPWHQRITLLARVCDAVAYAHQQGVIHRDLKPANILVDHDGQPQVLDFGLGWILNDDEPSEARAELAVAGTPSYMAPEQTLGMPGDTRTDVYALGVILYQLLTGKLPITPDRDSSGTFRRIREDQPPSPGRIAGYATPEVSAIIAKTLAKRPADRYPSVEAFAADLRNALQRRPVTAHPTTTTYRLRLWLQRNRLRVILGTLAASAVGMLICVAAMAWYAQQTQTNRAIADQQARLVMNGRLNLLERNPTAAARNLLDAYHAARIDPRLDPVFPRYALLEHYWHYPCIWAVPARTTDARPLEIAWSAHENILATCWSNNRLRLWNMNTRTEIPLKNPPPAPTCLIADPRNAQFLVGSNDGSLHRLAPLPHSTRWFAQQIRPPSQHPIQHLALTTDGQHLAIACPANIRFHVRRHDTWQQTLTWNHAHAETFHIAFHPTDPSILAAVFEKHPSHGRRWWPLILYNHLEQRPIATLIADGQHHKRMFIRTLAFAPDSRYIYLAEEHLQVWNWKTDTIQPLQSAQPTRGEWGIRSLLLLQRPADAILAYAAGNGRVILYDLHNQRYFHCEGFRQCTAEDLALAASPDGTRLASAGCDGLKLWKLPDTPMPNLTHGITELSLSKGPRPTWIAFERLNPKTHQNDPAHDTLNLGYLNQQNQSIPTHQKRLTAHTTLEYKISPNARWITRITGEPSNDLLTLAICPADDPLNPCAEYELADCFDAKTRFCLNRNDRFFLIWQGGRPANNGVATGHVSEATFDQNRRSITLHTLREFDSPCTWVDVDSRQRWLAACTEGRPDDPRRHPARVALFRIINRPNADKSSTPTYEFLTEFPTGIYTWRVTLLYDRHDNLIIATTGHRRDIALWAPDGRPLGAISGHEDAIFRCNRLTDRLFVTTSRDHSIRIWDVWSRQELCAFRHLPGTADPALAIRDGRIAFTTDRTLHILDTRELDRYIQTLSKHYP